MNILPLIGPLVRPLMNRGIAMRTSQFEVLPAMTGRVVFLGDSITEGGCWEEWFPELPACNRGIGGDTVGGVRSRLGAALHDPVAVSLLIGTNDLGGMGKTRKVEGIADQVGELIGAIRTSAPEATLLVNSVMPRVASMEPKIRRLNDHYARLAADAGGAFVDLWPVLAAADGSMRDEFTADHIHLNGAGYRAWVDVLRPHLTPFAHRDHE